MPLTKKLERAYGGRRGLAATTIALLGIALLVTPLVMVSGSIVDGATLGVLLPNAKFLTAGDAGDLVKLSLGLGG